VVFGKPEVVERGIQKRVVGWLVQFNVLQKQCGFPNSSCTLNPNQPVIPIKRIINAPDKFQISVIDTVPVFFD
jgi:hypothetical protein